MLSLTGLMACSLGELDLNEILYAIPMLTPGTKSILCYFKLEERIKNHTAFEGIYLCGENRVEPNSQS